MIKRGSMVGIDDGLGGEAVPSSRTRAIDTYRRIRQDILECRLRPGARLRSEELCEQYEVGISPLREALVRLSADGLAVLEEHRGYHVAPVSRADLLDLTRMRIELERMALTASIRNGDDDWETRVVAAHHRLSKTEAFVEGNRILGQGWEERHANFHRALLEACGSPWLLSFRDALYDHGGRYRRLSLQQGPSLSRPADTEHQDILQAALDRDVERACSLLTQHIQRTTDMLLAQDDPALFGEG
jgi:DNA-binding GntR family transcriptional regulator